MTQSFSPDRWRQVEGVFAATIERPAPERPTFLDRACGDDFELRRQVESLLKADDEHQDFLEHPRGWLESDPASETAPLQPIGQYQILGLIGVGGMSRIYLGEKTVGEARHQVAIKLTDKQQDSSARRLFERETQILCRLSHPNIARFLDAGISEENIPFLVMEYVDGVPITEYCDIKRLGLRPRIALFIKVCGAVQCAHQNLILHRDLKPSNILVTDEGEPKLLDFGIGKDLEWSQTLETSEATVTRDRFLTPSHASPEQWRGAVVTTASDVYALGVLLYELLTGCLPFDLRQGAATEALNAFERGPRLPSLVAGEGMKTVARPWARQLRGDLDTMILHCLNLKPGERYGSVEQLIADLQRYLQGLPVIARRPFLTYRLKKFIRRNALTVFILSLLTLSLIAFVVILALYSDRLATERTASQEARLEAERVTLFLTEGFRQADPAYHWIPGKENPPAISAYDVLTQNRERVSREFKGQPLLQARLQDTLAETFGNMGHRIEAIELFGQALATKRNHFASPPELIHSLNGLGSSLMSAGRLREAQVVLREALALGRQHHVSRTVLADSLLRSGTLRLEISDYEGAEQLLEEAVEIRRSAGDSNTELLAKTLIGLGSAHLFQKDVRHAEAPLREGLAILEDLPGRHGPDIAEALYYLGFLHSLKAEPETARIYLHRAANRRLQLHGPEHPDTLESRATYAGILVILAEYDTAADILRDVLALDRKNKGDAHPHVAINLQNLAEIAWQQGDLAAAEQWIREALDRATEAWGPQNRATLNYQRQLAQILHERGYCNEAVRTLRKVLSQQNAILTTDDRHIGFTSTALADLHATQGRLDLARPLAEEGLRITTKNFAPDHFRIGEAKSVLGSSLAASTEAEGLLQEGLSLIIAANGPGLTPRYARRARYRLDRLSKTSGAPCLETEP